MKRLLAWLMLLVLCLTACSKNQEKKKAFVLYFPGTQTAFIEKKTDWQPKGLSELISAYAKQQPPKGALPAIPDKWSLQSAVIEDGVAIVSFTGKRTSELERNKAAACLLRTILQMPEVDTLHLSAPGYDLFELKREDLLLTDSSMQPQKESIVLYVPDKDGRFLTRRTQTVEAVEAADKPQYVLSQLFETAQSCFPKGTTLLNISIENEICTVDLSSEFLHNMKPSFHCERMAVYSIVNSLTELPEVTTVDIWVEGAPLEELKYMKLPNGMTREESLIAPKETNVLDVTLYATCDGKTLVAVPITVARSEELTDDEVILEALLSFTSLDGARNPIAEGTKRLSVLRESNTCIIDLTGEFLDGCKDSVQERLAVQSVIATMCDLKGIAAVEILVEGLEPDYSDETLKNLSQPQDEWFSEE